MIAIYGDICADGQIENQTNWENRIYQGENLPSMYQSAAVSVMDVRTGLVIYENSQHDFMYPASVTKIMTTLLILEEIEDLQENLVITEHSVFSLPHYASRINVEPGDTLTIREALYGLMLSSGNEVAYALAERVSGSTESFVRLMNHRAAELGAVNTRFINPSGLPGYNQHTTAYDMALIMREAVNHPVFNEIISTPSFFIGPTESQPYGMTLYNTNLMIWHEDFYNPWIIGGKTGFTNAAQNTLVSYARQGDTGLIVSVLYAPRLATFTDTAALLDHVASLPHVAVFETSGHYWRVPVVQEINNVPTDIGSAVIGMRGETFAGGRSDLRIPMPANVPHIRTELDIPTSLTPPVRVGDMVGYKSFYAGNMLIYQMELVSMDMVLPQTANPRQWIEAPDFNFTFVPFFSFMLVSTVILMGMLLVTVRRHRKMMRRRQRRMAARVKYARYGGLE